MSIFPKVKTTPKDKHGAVLLPPHLFHPFLLSYSLQKANFTVFHIIQPMLFLCVCKSKGVCVYIFPQFFPSHKSKYMAYA